MEYSTFKSLQALLFFGSAMGFSLWQLAVIRRIRREDALARQKAAEATAGDAAHSGPAAQAAPVDTLELPQK